MRMSRTAVAGILVLLLGSGPGGGVLAQQSGADSGYTHISGKVVDEAPWHGEDARMWEDEGIVHLRGTLGEWTAEWSDPRLPATMWSRIDGEGYGWNEPDGGVTPYATTVLLLGDEGSWSGIGRGVGTDATSFIQIELVGEGAYDGLYAIIERTDVTLDDGSVQRTFDGYIFEGELTPMPESVSSSVAEPRTAADEVTPSEAEAAADAGGSLTGTMTFIEDIDLGDSTSTGSLLEIRGASATYDLQMSDPRYSGGMTTLDFTVNGYGGNRLAVGGGTELVTADGTWTGSATGIYQPTMGWQILYRLDGRGELQGMTYYLHAASPEKADGVWEMDGFVAGRPPAE